MGIKPKYPSYLNVFQSGINCSALVGNENGDVMVPTYDAVNFLKPHFKKVEGIKLCATLISVSTTLEWLLCGSLPTVHQQQSRCCQRYHVLWAFHHHWCQIENLPVRRNSWLLYWCVIMQLSGRRIVPRRRNVIMHCCLSCVELHKHSTTTVATRLMTIWRQ